MGLCQYCGQKAGWFRSEHPACHRAFVAEQERVTAWRSGMVAEVATALLGTEGFDALETRLREKEAAAGMPDSARRELLLQGWERFVHENLENKVLDADQDDRLGGFRDHFGLTQEELDRGGAWTKTVQCAILRDVLNGKVPTRLKMDGSLPINFHKDEQVVWIFPRTGYLEDKTRRQFVGGSQGVSLRLAKGVYYRLGQFKGHPVESTERVRVDAGLLIVTSKNLYFHGPLKSFRVPFEKILSFDAFSDGVGIMRDAQTAKPQIFVTGDGWFSYNLVVNLAKL
jgi:hypothetical protein